MKAINQIKSDIEDLKGKIKLARTLDKSEAALSKKILTLNKAIIYMESVPEKEHLLSQKQSVTRKLEIYAQRYEAWLNSDDKHSRLKNPKKEYAKRMEIDLAEIKRLKQELALINYIIN